MTTSTESELITAIESRHADQILEQIQTREFILIRVNDDDEEGENQPDVADDEYENIGALTATIDAENVLVSFTSESAAGKFVEAMGAELFAEGEAIDGFMVDGKTLLEYLPEHFGLLINPENELTAVIDAALAAQIQSATQ